MSPQRVVIIHGYNANPASHWFAAVADALEALLRYLHPELFR